jgi:HAD superfamily hydrolase (TIGR01450 family)
MIGLVLDLDGVVYRARQAVAGAADALAWADRHHRVLFATNNSSRTPVEVASKVTAITGFRASPEMVVTSALAAAAIADPVPTHVVGGAGITQALEGRGIPIAEASGAAQVVSGIDFGFTYESLTAAATTLRHGARWIATNTDATYPVEEGEWPGAGAVVAALATASGRTPEVAGKPHRPMIELVADRLGPDPTHVVVVGDRPETDLALARAAGWTAVLALSGVTRAASDVPADLSPDATIGTLGELPALLRRLGVA